MELENLEKLQKRVKKIIDRAEKKYGKKALELMEEENWEEAEKEVQKHIEKVGCLNEGSYLKPIYTIWYESDYTCPICGCFLWADEHTSNGIPGNDGTWYHPTKEEVEKMSCEHVIKNAPAIFINSKGIPYCKHCNEE